MIQVDVTMRGEVSDEARELAAEKIGALDRYVNCEVPARACRAPPMEANPQIERPARAEGDVLLEVGGQSVRAHVVELDAMTTAIDESRPAARAAASLVRREQDHRAGSRIVLAGAGGVSGGMGGIRPTRARRSSRGRRKNASCSYSKTIAVGELDAVQAAAEMEMLDHDFYLYREVDPEVDAVVYRRDDGRIGVIGPAGIGWSGPDEGRDRP